MKCIRWFQITTMAIASMLFLVISGCGSVQPLRPDQLEKLRSGKIAVSAYDRSKTITYNNLTYYGLGIAQTQTTATYAGFFDSEKKSWPHQSKQPAKWISCLSGA